MKIKSHTEIDYEKFQVFRLTRQNDDDPFGAQKSIYYNRFIYKMEKKIKCKPLTGLIQQKRVNLKTREERTIASFFVL